VRGAHISLRGNVFLVRGRHFWVRGNHFSLRGYPYSLRGNDFPMRVSPILIRGYDFNQKKTILSSGVAILFIRGAVFRIEDMNTFYHSRSFEIFPLGDIAKLNAFLSNFFKQHLPQFLPCTVWWCSTF
jgi:hypothetical protein